MTEVGCFRELKWTETACDRELERLCARRKLGRKYPFILFGDEMIEYYRITTNNVKDTLYLVFADCTMRLKQASESVPVSRSTVIYPGWQAARPSCSLDREVAYLVEFSGAL